MANWPRIPIKELGEVFDGPHATPQTVDKGPLFLGISSLDKGRIRLSETRHVTEDDFIKWTRRVEPQANDFVFSYETKIGEAALIPEGMRCCLGRRMGLVRLDTSRVDPRFFLYVYLSPDFQEFLRSKTINGATVDRLSLKEFGDFPFPCPKLGVQRAIAAMLGALDDKIELNRRMNKTMEAMARAIFKSWFVNFDPVYAKMEGRETGFEADIVALFPERFADEGLPEGWDRAELCEQFDLSPRTPLGEKDELPYVDMAALPTNAARVNLVAKRSPTSGARFLNGDALLARITPCLENGKAAYVDFLDHDQVGIGSTEFIVFRPKGQLSGIWAYLLMREETFRSHAIANMSGTSGRQRVSSEALAPWSISLPPLPVIKAFDAITIAIFTNLKARDDVSGTLAALRDLLLPKLISGEVRIKDAEKLVGEAGV